jgi:hypothetical protein
LKWSEQAERELRAVLAIREDYVPALESLIALLLVNDRKDETQTVFNQLGRADPQRTSVAWGWLNNTAEG